MIPWVVFSRYASHHINIRDNDFTMEHPLSCGITECDLMHQCAMKWIEKPADNGWWRLDEGTLELSDPEDRITYEARPL